MLLHPNTTISLVFHTETNKIHIPPSFCLSSPFLAEIYILGGETSDRLLTKTTKSLVFHIKNGTTLTVSQTFVFFGFFSICGFNIFSFLTQYSLYRHLQSYLKQSPQTLLFPIAPL